MKKGVILRKNRKLTEKQNNSNIDGKNTDKTKKSKVRFFLKLLGFVVLGVFIYFAVKSTSNTLSYSVFEKLDNLKQDKQPYLVIIGEDFSQVAKDNLKVIKKISKDGKKSMTVFDIDYDPMSISKDSEYFIDKYAIESLPVVILCDGNNDLIKAYYLPFDYNLIMGDVNRAGESSVK